MTNGYTSTESLRSLKLLALSRIGIAVRRPWHASRLARPFYVRVHCQALSHEAVDQHPRRGGAHRGPFTLPGVTPVAAFYPGPPRWAEPPETVCASVTDHTIGSTSSEAGRALRRSARRRSCPSESETSTARYTAFTIAPAGNSARVTHRQSAMHNLRATATIPMRRARRPWSAKRRRYHCVNALAGWWRTHCHASCRLTTRTVDCRHDRPRDPGSCSRFGAARPYNREPRPLRADCETAATRALRPAGSTPRWSPGLSAALSGPPHPRHRPARWRAADARG